MEKVAVIGPFNPIMKGALERAFKGKFELEYVPSREEYEIAYHADYIILRTLDLNANDISSMKHVRLIQRWGAGFDTVDIERAGARGIPVAITAGMNSTPVAEMSLALALAVYRNLVPLTNGIMSGKWEREEYSKRSFTLSGKTVGVVGLGSIGKKVAALYQAFGSEVIYYDAFRASEEQEAALGVEYMPLEQIFAKSDILTLHAPLLDSTRELINQDSLRKMKDGAVLINTAREELINMPAVAEALKTGKLLGAGFDAIEATILENNPFSGLSNVVLTAHLGGNTADNAEAMAKRCAEQITAIHDGKALEPPHLVNGKYLNG